jgi:putative ABC transport system substrate-binding protein
MTNVLDGRYEQCQRRRLCARAGKSAKSLELLRFSDRSVILDRGETGVKRGAFRRLVAGVTAALCAAFFAEKSASAYEVVVVQSFKNPVYDKTIEGFEQTCGGTIVTFTLNKEKRLDDDDLAQIKSKHPSAILAIGQSALTEILTKNPPMPVLFTAVTEKPSGSNPAAGILMNVPMERQLDTLLKIDPSLKSIGVIYNPSKTQYFVDDLQKAAKARGVTVTAVVATSGPDAVKDLITLFPTVDAYVLAPDTSIHSEPLEKMAGQLSVKLKKPVVGFKGTQLASGFLFASEMDPLEMGKQAGDIAHDLVAGKKPATPYMPVKKFKLILNPKVADALGLKIPADVSAGAKIYGVDSE